MPRTPKKPRPAPGDTILDTADAMRVMASPLRHAIVQVIIARGEASVSDIAWDLQRPAPTLYRHIDQLVEGGIVREVGTRSTGKRDARVFASGQVWYRYAPRSPARLEALLVYVRTMGRNAMRQMVRSFESKKAVTHGDARDTHFYSEFGWFDEEELAELNRRIDSVAIMFRNKKRTEGKRLIATTLIQSPRQTGE